MENRPDTPDAPDTDGSPTDGDAPVEDLSAWEAVLLAQPDDEEAIERYIALGVDGHEPRLRRTLQSLVKRNPAGVGPKFGRLLLAIRRDDEVRVQKAALDVLWLNPDHARTVALLGDERVARYRVKLLAFKELGERLKRFGERVRANDLTGISDELAEVIRQHPDYYPAFKLAFQLCARTSDTVRLRALLGIVKQDGIADPTVLHEAGRALVKVGRTTDALPYLVRALAASPTFDEPAHLIGKLLADTPALIEPLRDAVARYRDTALEPDLLDRLAAAHPPAASRLQQARDLELSGQVHAAASAYIDWAEREGTYDALVQAGTAVERLGLAGLAEGVYGRALQLRSGDPVAEAGGRRAREANAAPNGAAVLARAERAIQENNPDAAIELFQAWAAAANTAVAYSGVADRCRALGWTEWADYFTGRATALGDRPQPGDGPPDTDKLNSAREVVLKGYGPSLVPTVARLRSHGIGGDLEWLPADGAASALVRWLYGVAELQPALDAGIDPTQAREAAGLLAALELRWDDAAQLGIPDYEPVLAAAAALRAGAARPLDPLPELDAQVSAILQSEDHLAVPKLRRMTDNAFSRELMRTAQQAWDEANTGKDEDAEFHYRMASQSGESGADMAKCNQAILLGRLGRRAEAFEAFTDLRRRLPSDSPVLWGYVRCALQLGKGSLATAALRDGIARQENWRIRVVLAALLAADGQFRAAREQLQCGNRNLFSDPVAQAFLLRLVERLDPAGLAETLDALATARAHRLLGIAKVPPAAAAPVLPPAPTPAPVVPVDAVRKMTRAELDDHIRGMKRRHGHDEVVAFLQQYKKAFPKFIPVCLLLARELSAGGQPEEAVAELVRGLKHCPVTNAGQLQVALTEAQLAANRVADAIKTVERFTPQAMNVHPMLFRDALAIARRVANADPTQVGRQALIRFMRAAKLPEEQVRAEVGEAEFRATGATKPAPAPVGKPAVKLNVQRIEAEVKRLLKIGHADSALKYLLAFLAQNRDHPDLIRLQAEVCVDRGDEEKAVALLRAQIGRLPPDDSRKDRLLLANTYARLKRSEDELREYMALLDRNPFDESAHEHLTRCGLERMLPCVVNTPALLLRCEVVFRERQFPEQEKLRRDLAAVGPTAEVKGIARVLVGYQPDVGSWQRLNEALVGDMAGGSLPALTPTPFTNSPPPPRAAAVAPVGRPVAAAVIGSPTAGDRQTAWDQLSTRRSPTAYLAALDQLCPRFARQLPPSARPARADAAEVGRILDALIAQALEDGPEESNPHERTELAMEVGWLYRMAARCADGDERRAEALAAHFQRKYLPECLAALCSHPASETYTRCGELGKLALDVLPRRWRELRGHLRDLDKLADRMRLLAGSANVSERRAFAQEASGIGSALVRRFTQHIDAGTRDGVRRLVRGWQAEIDSWQRQMAEMATIKCTVSVSEAGWADEFEVEMLVSNDAPVAAEGLVFAFTAPPGLQCDRPPTRLLPRGKARMSMRIGPVPADERAVELRGTVRYKVPGDLDNEFVIGEVLTPPWVIAPKPIHSPYVVGNPVLSSSPSFIERRELLRTIRDCIRIGAQANVVLLHGLRRVGKTSLLKALQDHPDAGTLPRYIDLQNYKNKDTTTATILKLLAEPLADAVQLRGGRLDLPPLTEWEGAPFVTFRRVAEEAERALAAPPPDPLASPPVQRVLYLLDEFEELLQLIGPGQVDLELLGFLRSFMQHAPHMAFVLVGANRVTDMLRSHNSPLYNLMLRIPVGYLSTTEARQLITEPLRRAQVGCSEDAVRELIRLSGGHPYLLQDLCHQLVGRLNGRPDDGVPPRDYVTLLDVEAVRDENTKVADHRVFDSFWRDYGLPKEALLLLAVIAEEGGSCTSRLLATRLADEGYPMTDSKAFDLIGSKLTELNFAAYDRRPDQSFDYRIALPLFALWIRNHHVVPNVLRDLLDTVADPALVPDWSDIADDAGDE